MLNLDPAKLLVIAVVAVILLGPDRLPQVARQVGAAWRSFAEFRHKMEADVRSSIPDLPSSADIARLARSPSALLDHLSNLDTASSVDTASSNGDASAGPAASAGSTGPAAPTSADAPRNESPVTGLPITRTDSVTPVPQTPVPQTPVPPTTSPAQPTNPPDPSLN